MKLASDALRELLSHGGIRDGDTGDLVDVGEFANSVVSSEPPPPSEPLSALELFSAFREQSGSSEIDIDQLLRSRAQAPLAPASPPRQLIQVISSQPAAPELITNDADETQTTPAGITYEAKDTDVTDSSIYFGAGQGDPDKHYGQSVVVIDSSDDDENVDNTYIEPLSVTWEQRKPDDYQGQVGQAVQQEQDETGGIHRGASASNTPQSAELVNKPKEAHEEEQPTTQEDYDGVSNENEEHVRSSGIDDAPRASQVDTAGGSGVEDRVDTTPDFGQEIAHSTRSQCTLRRLTLSQLPGAPTFIVHECALDPARLAEEGAEQSELYTDALDMRPLVADELPEDVYHALTRIIGLSMLDKVSVVPGSLGDQWMQQAEQEEEDEDAKEAGEEIEEKDNGAQESGAVQTPSPAHRHTKQTYSRRGRRSDPQGDMADYIPPEEAKAEPESPVGDVSIEELERLETSSHKRKSDEASNDRRMRLRSADERRAPRLYSP